MDMSSKRIFITGGASGLGLALAKRYAKEGYRVCLGDVNDQAGETARAEVSQAGSPEVLYLRCDVTREEDLQHVADQLSSRWGGVDIVVNNAGVAQAGGIDEVSIADWQWILDINLMGVVRGCKVFTPLFKRQGSGYFVNIASMAGLLDMPKMSSYNVSKAAVVSLSETLQNELVHSKIRVSVVCPSFFKTNLGDSLRAPDPKMRVLVGKLLSRGKLSADEVADQVYDGVKNRSFYILPHVDGRAIWKAKTLLPRPVYAAIVENRSRWLMRM
jgi:NAD(P)-dependent dehydrogenase (short-subunit alcohol dehydrogenase family)